MSILFILTSHNFSAYKIEAHHEISKLSSHFAHERTMPVEQQLLLLVLFKKIICIDHIRPPLVWRIGDIGYIQVLTLISLVVVFNQRVYIHVPPLELVHPVVMA